MSCPIPTEMRLLRPRKGNDKDYALSLFYTFILWEDSNGDFTTFSIKYLLNGMIENYLRLSKKKKKVLILSIVLIWELLEQKSKTLKMFEIHVI